MKNCPICGAKTSHTQSCVDVGFGPGNGSVEESETRCPDGHYHEEFCYGGTRLNLSLNAEDLHGLELVWSYTSGTEEMELVEKLTDAYIKYARLMRTCRTVQKELKNEISD